MSSASRCSQITAENYPKHQQSNMITCPLVDSTSYGFSSSTFRWPQKIKGKKNNTNQVKKKQTKEASTRSMLMIFMLNMEQEPINISVRREWNPQPLLFSGVWGVHRRVLTGKRLLPCHRFQSARHFNSRWHAQRRYRYSTTVPTNKSIRG